MSFLFELDPKDEAVSNLVSRVGKQLQRAVASRGVTQNEIAQRLGVDRSRVNKCLSGFNNLTLKSLAEIAWALDGTVNVEIELKIEDPAQSTNSTGSNVVAFAGQQAPRGQEQEQSAVLLDQSTLERAFG